MILRQLRPADQLVLGFERIADTLQAKTSRAEVLSAAAITVALLGIWTLAYATNGASGAYLHAMYVPIIAASLTFGMLGGALTALCAGILVGPLLPLSTEVASSQPIEYIIVRSAFFVLVAVVTGAFATSSRERQRLLEEAKDGLSDMTGRNLRLFARLVAERDEQTAAHCERVAKNTVVIARALGLSESMQQRFYWAALLHDLGKLGVPEALLRKRGRLTSEEFQIIKQHPELGQEILLDISDTFQDIAAGVRSHHERWDGQGYPDRLRGEDIPLVARILAVVDVFEAVTSVRSYRAPMDVAVARRLIMEGAGTHFDPKIATMFLGLERSGSIVREIAPDDVYDEFPTTMIEPTKRYPTLFN